MLPLQVMDFNGDRLNDIVLVARDGIYAWAQVRPAAHSRTSPHLLQACGCTRASSFDAEVMEACLHLVGSQFAMMRMEAGFPVPREPPCGLCMLATFPHVWNVHCAKLGLQRATLGCHVLNCWKPQGL